MNQQIKYELFQQQIVNDEHRVLLHYLLNLQYGKYQFCLILKKLIEELNSEYIVDLGCYKIFNCQTNFIEIFLEVKQQKKEEINLQEKQYKPKIQIIPKNQISMDRNSPQNSEEDKINNFFNALFSTGPLKNDYFKNNYKTILGKNIACQTQWIFLFQQFWLPKKQQQYKVVHLKKQFESLILLPNSDIILTSTNHNQNILMTNTSKIFYNQIQSNSNPETGIYPDFSKFNLKITDVCYIGNLDPTAFFPSNQGSYHISKIYDSNQAGYIKPADNNKEEPFTLGLPQNQYICNLSGFEKAEYNFQNGLISDNQNQRHKEKYIAYSEISTVSFQFMKGLLSGGWVLQTILDYLVEELYETYRIVIQSMKHQDQLKKENQVFIIDTREIQDIFSTQIGKIDQVNRDAINSNKVRQQYQQHEGNFRVIYLILVDSSHFICAAFESQNKTVYVLNSMSSESDQRIADSLKKHLHPEAKTKLLDIAQQQNGFDCSIHTLYNTIQLLTQNHIIIEKIDFKNVTRQVISELRQLVFQKIMQQNDWLNTLSKFKKIIKNQKKQAEQINRITQN